MTNEKFSKLFWPAVVALAALWAVCFAGARKIEEKRQTDKIKAISDMYEKVVER